ncbi:MAG TPA: DUF1330 domain-containing protein [Steroidobacteraceae bacterium]|nr:DUF1330 domain-containing protein [Steroidobacteraceae bacterium]
MPAYGFFDVREVTDANKLEQYRQSVAATVARHGGRYLSVGGPCDAIEGRWRPVFPVLIEFPSLQHAHRWYGSPEYRDLKALRLAATKGDAVFFDGSGMDRLGEASSGASTEGSGHGR